MPGQVLALPSGKETGRREDRRHLRRLASPDFHRDMASRNKVIRRPGGNGGIAI